MIFFLGLITLLFYSIFFGWIWPNKGNLTLIHSFIDGIGKSLWLSWTIIFIIYFLKIEGKYLIPILMIIFVVLWSLIYKAQNNIAVEYIVKLSLFISPLLILSIAGLLWQIKYRLFSFIYFILSLVLIFTYGGETLSGNMDSHVAIFTLITCIISILILKHIDNENSNFSISLINTLGIYVGLTSIIKQAGVLSLFTFIIFLLILKFHKKITIKTFITNLIISIIPFLLFYILFNSTDGELIGNLNYLSNLVVQQAGEKGNIIHALRFLQSGLGPIFIVVVFFIGSLNFFKFKTLIGKLGVLYLITAIVGFFIYSDCCAYAPRNGWWIVSFLLGSFFCFFSNIYKINKLLFMNNIVYFKNKIYSIFVFTLFLPTLFLGTIMTDSKSFRIQTETQWTLVPSNIANFLKNNSTILKDDNIIISPIDKIKFLPKYKQKYKWCDYQYPECFNETITKYKRSFVIIEKKEFYKHYLFLNKFSKNSLKIKNINANKDTNDEYLFIGPIIHSKNKN